VRGEAQRRRPGVDEWCAGSDLCDTSQEFGRDQGGRQPGSRCLAARCMQLRQPWPWRAIECLGPVRLCCDQGSHQRRASDIQAASRMEKIGRLPATLPKRRQ
jgi:hypothetical protein